MEKATIPSTRKYQRKIGSLLYAAIVTRPDIAFAVSKLSRFNTNPSNEHYAAADRVLDYLQAIRNHALRLGGGYIFEVYINALFADNTMDRKSL